MNRSLLRFTRRANGERGFYLIGLLLTLAIVAILVGGQWSSYTGSSPQDIQGVNHAADAVSNMDPEPQGSVVSTAQGHLDRSRDTACDAQRSAIRGTLTMEQAMSGGAVPDRFAVRPKVSHIVCPRRGQYSYDDQLNVYCTLHHPAPEGMKTYALSR